MELLKTNTAEAQAVYEHPYWGAYAGITRNSYGKGTAYYVGCYTEKDILKDIYRQGAREAGIPLQDWSWPVILRSGETKEGRKLHFILHYSEEERDILCPFEEAENILSGKIYRNQDVIHLKDWDVLVLKEK